jgi:hypothetical protein
MEVRALVWLKYDKEGGGAKAPCMSLSIKAVQEDVKPRSSTLACCGSSL